MRSLTHTAKCRRFIYSPECLGIMSRKRSEGSARDIKVETSGALFELEDSRDKEKLSVTQRQRTQGGRTFLTEREREREIQDFDEITEGSSTGISTVR